MTDYYFWLGAKAEAVKEGKTLLDIIRPVANFKPPESGQKEQEKKDD